VPVLGPALAAAPMDAKVLARACVTSAVDAARVRPGVKDIPEIHAIAEA